MKVAHDGVMVAKDDGRWMLALTPDPEDGSIRGNLTDRHGNVNGWLRWPRLKDDTSDLEAVAAACTWINNYLK
ncbi:hypothetical protein [Bifidobacterium leontopitheci]|uniref:Uncharacterized protein n=1 Tax=Bifidobacterium leontopitheci TaxID=2650774 RepID=A0A6I1GW46_9BIFI|nr:hypothetical protein [Bifidobacterium leontopitheci]KAB7790681.1 hypothetical protein F7D09_0787 [Bifidobacterium leontopitheci]